MIVEDINTTRPAYIFVDATNLKAYYEFIHFDYLAYLAKNPDFRAAFKHYRYTNTVEQRPPISPEALTAWNIAVIPNKANIHPKDFSSSVVVLTGDGETKKVYLVFQKKFLASHYQVFSTEFTPTHEQQQFLAGQKGLIKRTSATNTLINQIIKSNTNFPTYRLQVYRRVISGEL
jgi:hypothetical protein